MTFEEEDYFEKVATSERFYGIVLGSIATLVYLSYGWAIACLATVGVGLCGGLVKHLLRVHWSEQLLKSLTGEIHGEKEHEN